MFKIIIIWLCTVASLSVTAAAEPVSKTVLEKQVLTNPADEAMVLIDDKPVFAIKAKLFALTPADRATLVSQRLIKLLKDPFANLDSIKVVNNELTADIVSGDKVLMSVTDVDALAEGKTRTAIAEEHANLIKTRLAARIKEYSSRSILLGVVYSLLATFALIFLIMMINYLLPRLISMIETWKIKYVKTLKLQSVEVMHKDKIISIIETAAKVIRFIIIIVLFNFYIPLIMSFFPWSRIYSTKFIYYIINPIKSIATSVVAYLPNTFDIFIIVAITYAIIKLTKFIFMEVEKGTITLPGFYTEWAKPTFNIIRFLIIMLALVAAFPYIPGSNSPAFKGISVFLGLLISLGSSSAISNIVAGVILTYTRAFKVGDRIQIGEALGDVIENNLLVTRLRTIKQVDITVPNSMVLGSHINNFSSKAKQGGLILHTTITIGYDVAWRTVHELLLSAAKETGHVLDSPPPFVLQTALNDFYVSYQINIYTDNISAIADTYSQLHQNIQDRFNESGVEIMSPHYSQLRDGNRTTIPHDYLPGDYQAPALRVEKIG